MNIQSLEQLTTREYHALTGKLASRGMQLKAERGIYPSAAPLGYKNVRINGESRLEIDPEVAPLIRHAFELHKSGRSVRKVLRTVTAKGLRSNRGKILTPSALWHILKNPVYRGIVRWNNTDYLGVHEPILPRAQRG